MWCVQHLLCWLAGAEGARGTSGSVPMSTEAFVTSSLFPFELPAIPGESLVNVGSHWVCLVLHFTTWNSFCTIFKIVIKLFLCHGLCAARPVCWAKGSTPGISELGPALPSNRGPSSLERSLSPSLKIASSLTCLSSPWVVPFLFFFFSCKTFTFPYSWLGHKLLSPERIHLCSVTIYWLSSKQKQFAFLWAFHFTNIQNDTLKEKLMYTHSEAQTRCSWALGALVSPSDQDQRFVNSVLMRL